MVDDDADSIKLVPKEGYGSDGARRGLHAAEGDAAHVGKGFHSFPLEFRRENLQPRSQRNAQHHYCSPIAAPLWSKRSSGSRPESTLKNTSAGVAP